MDDTTDKANCPTCGRPMGLTGAPISVPGPHGRFRIHTRDEATLARRFTSGQDKVADKVTAFSGSLTFVYLHAVWFAVWLVVNGGVFGAALIFDKFPFGLLTLIVSLEAIFLSTFVLVSQNRQGSRDNLRSELDFETNLRSEIWSVKIGHSLGLDPGEIEMQVQEALRRSRASLADGSAGGGAATSAQVASDAAS